ncbi:hypothetical protein DPMN_012582 [Dreissena polymorpha]|uniref:Uncharacterized protein n=1 Tax=Dreissena polymorpha TaxID=45954 RepID=A0A9D4N5T0_DREPO|nr:hypothetical protein DPMN_012582 [Dreissena polymorpha]
MARIENNDYLEWLEKKKNEETYRKGKDEYFVWLEKKKDEYLDWLENKINDYLEWQDWELEDRIDQEKEKRKWKNESENIVNIP